MAKAFFRQLTEREVEQRGRERERESGERGRGGEGEVERGRERVCIANGAFYCLKVFLLRQAYTWFLCYPLATFAYICPRFQVSGCMLSFDERHEVSVCLWFAS